MAEDFKDFILKRLWETYHFHELNRKKAFNILVLTLSVITLLWIAPTENIQLPVLGYELSIFLTLSIAPFFIVFLTSRYFYLSALTLNSYISFIKKVNEIYLADSEDADLLDVYNKFRLRDISETLSIFIFPRQYEHKFKFNLNIIIHYITIFGHRFVTLLTFIIPLLYASVSTYWLINNFDKHLKFYEGYIVITSYVFLHIILILFFYYLINRTEDSRKYFREKIVKINGIY